MIRSLARLLPVRARPGVALGLAALIAFAALEAGAQSATPSLRQRGRAAATPAPPSVSTFSLGLQDVEIRELVRILGKQAGVTVYTDPSVSGVISVHVQDLPLEEALRSILVPRGFAIQRFVPSGETVAARYFVYDPAGSRRLYVHVADDALTADIQRFQLADVLAEVAREANRSIVLHARSEGPLTLALRNVPFEEALREIARAGGCRLMRSGEGERAVYRVVAAEGAAPAGGVEIRDAHAPAAAATAFDVTTAADGRVRVRATEAPLKDLLLAIAEAGKLSIVFAGADDATISAVLSDLSAAEAIQTLAERAGLPLRREGTTFVVLSSTPGRFQLHGEDGLVTLVANEAPLLEVLNRLGEDTSLPRLIYAPGLGGTITIRVDQVAPLEALNRIAAARQLRLEGEDRTLRVIDPARERRTLIVQRAGLVTVELQNTPVREALAEFSRVLGVNITAPEADSPVTLALHAVGLSTALRAVAEQAELELIEEPERYRLLAREAGPRGYVHAALDPQGRLTIEARDAELTHFARTLADVTHGNFLVETGTVGSVSGRLENVPFEAGLRMFLSSKGFRLRRTGGIYRIASAAAGAAAEASPVFEIALDSDRLSLNVTDADLGALLRQIAEDAGMNLALYGAVRDKVNVILQDVPLESGLARILAGTRFGYLIQDSTLIVGDISQANTPLAAMSLREEIIPLQYFSVKEVPALLPAEIPAAQVKVIEGQNALLVSGRPELIDRARTFVANLDRPPTQIQIEALLVEYRNTKAFTYNLSTLTVTGAEGNVATFAPSQGAVSFTVTDLQNFNNPQFQAGLTALVDRNEAAIRARPSIATVSGREAKINVQSQENFRVTQPSTTQGVPLVQIQTITSGITLRITPYVAGDAGDAVTIDVFIEDSSAGDRTADGLPSIATRNAQNRVVVQSGRTAVIGGLIRNDESRIRGGFPILSQIPIIGGIFGRRATSDRESTLVFYLTPRVIRSDTTVAESFAQHGVPIEPEVYSPPPTPVPQTFSSI